MGICKLCGKKIWSKFTCRICEEDFCEKCKLPEFHGCRNVSKYVGSRYGREFKTPADRVDGVMRRFGEGR